MTDNNSAVQGGETTHGERMDAARMELITYAQQQADARPEYAVAFKQLAAELLDAPTSMDEFLACVRRTRPHLAHTMEWDTHPDGWEDECYCGDCLSYMGEDA